MLFLAGVFQASALFNVKLGTKVVPLTPYYFFLLALVLLGIWRLGMGVKIRLVEQELQPALVFLFLFVLVSGLSILVGPSFFSGLPVYVPGDGIDPQYHNMGHLVFSVSMVGQLLYLLLNFAAFCTLLFLRWPSPSPNQVMRLIAAATLLVFGFSIWQLLHNQIGVWFPSQFIYTVEGWSVGNDQVLGGYGRINATFTEPSTLAVFMAGILGFWVRLLIGRFSWFALLLSLSAFLVLMLSSSTTAYLTILVLALIVLYRYVVLPMLGGRYVLSRGTVVLIVIGFFALGMVLVLSLTSPSFYRFLDAALLDKTASLSFIHRFAADERAIQILWDTHGLGVGLGGNRPSSFVTSLLSNVGIIGFVLFLGFLLSLTGQRGRHRSFSIPVSDEEYRLVFSALSWALWMTILGMVISVPDLPFPPLWIWVFVLVLFSAGRRVVDRSAINGCAQ